MNCTKQQCKVNWITVSVNFFVSLEIDLFEPAISHFTYIYISYWQNTDRSNKIHETTYKNSYVFNAKRILLKDYQIRSDALNMWHDFDECILFNVICHT